MSMVIPIEPVGQNGYRSVRKRLLLYVRQRNSSTSDINGSEFDLRSFTNPVHSGWKDGQHNPPGVVVKISFFSFPRRVKNDQKIHRCGWIQEQTRARLCRVWAADFMHGLRF
jgi:hypothetical protein